MMNKKETPGNSVDWSIINPGRNPNIHEAGNNEQSLIHILKAAVLGI